MTSFERKAFYVNFFFRDRAMRISAEVPCNSFAPKEIAIKSVICRAENEALDISPRLFAETFMYWTLFPANSFNSFSKKKPSDWRSFSALNLCLANQS